MTRDEMMKLPCWSCWWREGPNCYSREIFDAQVALGNHEPDDGTGAWNPSIEIYAKLPKPHIEVDDEQPCTCYMGKRQMLGKYFEGIAELVIVSEKTDH